MADLSFSNPYQNAIDESICYVCFASIEDFTTIYCQCTQCCTTNCSCKNVPVNVPICKTCKESL